MVSRLPPNTELTTKIHEFITELESMEPERLAQIKKKAMQIKVRGDFTLNASQYLGP